jgi:hypothetical protein
MKNSIILTLFILLGTELVAQNNIVIHKDARIDALVRKQGAIIPPATSPQLPGYRIQLFFDSDRKIVDSERAKFISIYPKMDSYLIYNAPNYVLKAGDFRTLLEAESIKSNLVKDFPTSFIVKEMINLPRIDID